MLVCEATRTPPSIFPLIQDYSVLSFYATPAPCNTERGQSGSGIHWSLGKKKGSTSTACPASSGIVTHLQGPLRQPAVHSDLLIELPERGGTVLLAERIPDHFQRQGGVLREEAAACPPYGGWLYGAFSLNRNGVPAGRLVKYGPGDGRQKFTSSNPRAERKVYRSLSVTPAQSFMLPKGSKS